MRLRCRLGFHQADERFYLVERRQRGKHKWHKNYTICKHCGKRLHSFAKGR